MIRLVVLACALLAIGAVATISVGHVSLVLAVEVLLLHGFFLADLVVRPPATSDSHDPSRWVITSKIFMLALMYLPVVFAPVSRQIIGLEIVGSAITCLGGLSLLWGRLTLGPMATENLTILEAHSLIQKGCYKFVRHPIYSGISLAFLGHQVAFLFLPGLFIWLLFIVFVIRSRIVREEGLLLAHFGQRYLEYQRKTWALFPCIY